MRPWFSDLFDDAFFGRPERAQIGEAHAVPMKCDVREFPDHFELEMELAGYDKDAIQAELSDGYLTVRASRTREEKDEQQGRILRQERYFGEVRRTFYVGEQVCREDVAASYQDGVLRLSIPKKEVRPELPEERRIPIL